MDLEKLIEEKVKRVALKNAIKEAIEEFDFKEPVLLMTVHHYIAGKLGRTIYNGLARDIKKELLEYRIVQAASQHKRYYRYVDNCKNYSWLKHKHLKSQD